MNKLCITFTRAEAADEQLFHRPVLIIGILPTSVGNFTIEFDYEVFTFNICLGIA